MFGSQLNRQVQTPDMALSQPPSDSISKMQFAPVITQVGGGTDILAVASWDNNVRLYAVSSDGQSQPRAMYSHDKPVLDLCWHTVSMSPESCGVLTDEEGRDQGVLGRLRWCGQML
jgi:WD40 repeat protein